MFKVLRPTQRKIGHFGDIGMEKQNRTQQKHAFISQKKCTKTQNKHKSSAIAEKADRCICLLLADRRHPCIL